MRENSADITENTALQRLADSAKYEHSRKVSEISLLMAKKAGFPPSEGRLIAQAALLHDVGKSGIPSHILCKPDALTPEEYEIVKTHTGTGGKQIADAAQSLAIAAVIARQHHEREDGRGYYRMAGKDIHPYAKLVAVADVFDALYSKRVYKAPWSMRKIKEYFTAQAGEQFDCDMVLLLFSILDDVPALYNKKQNEGKR